MKVIDARSGKEIHEGDQVMYEPDDGFFVHKIISRGIFTADADVTRIYRSPAYNRIVKNRRLQPLIVRILHPSFLFQRVAFYPS